jgi:hypothetical protein
VDDKSNINLYEYDIKNNKIRLIDKDRAAQPLPYKGISWISYDSKKNEYILKNLNQEMPVISPGSDYAKIYASNNIIVGYKNIETTVLYPMIIMNLFR